MKNKTKLKIQRTVAVSFAALAIGSAVFAMNSGFNLIDNSVDRTDLENEIIEIENERKMILDSFKQTDFFKFALEEEKRVSLEKLQNGELSDGEYTLHMAYVDTDSFVEDILRLSNDEHLKTSYAQLENNITQANSDIEKLNKKNTPYAVMTICAGIATIGATFAAYGSYPFLEEQKEK